MMRIWDKLDEQLGLEEINGALHALTLQPHIPRDLRHSQRTIFHRTQHLPTRRSEIELSGEAFAGSQGPSMQAEELENKLGVGCARGRMLVRGAGA